MHICRSVSRAALPKISLKEQLFSSSARMGVCCVTGGQLQPQVTPPAFPSSLTAHGNAPAVSNGCKVPQCRARPRTPLGELLQGTRQGLALLKFRILAFLLYWRVPDCFPKWKHWLTFPPVEWQLKMENLGHSPVQWVWNAVLCLKFVFLWTLVNLSS